MNNQVKNNLQQRKSSLSQFSKGKTVKQLSDVQPLKQAYRHNIVQKSQTKINPFQKSTAKQIYKTICQPQIAITENTSFYQQNKRSSSKQKDQQNNDYIRNLYKKYLGKQNKHQQTKSNFDIYTQRKMKTTQSKQILTNNSTTFKDYTKRALFTETQHKKYINTQMKKDKTKISTILSKQAQIEAQSQKKILTPLKKEKQNILKKTLAQRKQIVKNEQKNNFKQFDSKKSFQNYSSKSKGFKQGKRSLNTQTCLKRSNSTQFKKQQNQNFNPFTKNVIKQKMLSQNTNITDYQGQLIKKKRAKSFLQQRGIIPHRSSYCQFDTEQQLKKNQDKKFVPQKQCNENLSYEFKQKILKQQPNAKNQTQKQKQKESSGLIYERYINDLRTLQMLVGSESCLYKALNKINKARQIKKYQKDQWIRNKSNRSSSKNISTKIR